MSNNITPFIIDALNERIRCRFVVLVPNRYMANSYFKKVNEVIPKKMIDKVIPSERSVHLRSGIEIRIIVPDEQYSQLRGFHGDRIFLDEVKDIPQWVYEQIKGQHK